MLPAGSSCDVCACAHIQANPFLSDRDTVASVGIVMGRGLPFVGSNTTIRVFRHALSLDEVCDTVHRTSTRVDTFKRWAPCITCLVLNSTIFLIAPYQVPPNPVSPFSSCQSIVRVQEKRHWRRSTEHRCKGSLVHWLSFWCVRIFGPPGIVR